jgi:hypothetical protein
MSFPESWPERIRTVLANLCGVPSHIALMPEGESQAVWRVQFPEQSVVVKRSAQPRESIFYAKVAPTLAALDIPIPHLEWSGRDADTFWLVLEDIPTPLPRVRWGADQEMLSVLRRLHQRLPLNLDLAFPPFEPGWSDAMTNEALACFPSAQARRLAPILQDLQLSHQTLFTPRCWISGDPNPTNWGLRDDETIVLYDWERFGKATPAIDLAITVPVLSDRAVFQAVATTYLELDGRSSSLTTQEIPFLTQEIIVARIWSIIEYLSDYHTGAIARSSRIDILIQQIPAWMEKIVASKG